MSVSSACFKDIENGSLSGSLDDVFLDCARAAYAVYGNEKPLEGSVVRDLKFIAFKRKNPK